MKAEEVAERALVDLCTRDVIQLLDSGEEKQARAVMKMTGMSKTDMDKTVKEHEEMKKQTDMEEAVDLVEELLGWTHLDDMIKDFKEMKNPKRDDEEFLGHCIFLRGQALDFLKKHGREEKAIERYGKKLYWEFVELGFSGKPLGIEGVRTHIDYDLLSTELQKLIDDLPVVTIDESWDRGFFSDKLDGTQQFYIAIDKETESVFLIDTQGYEYARYVSHLKNMPCAKKEGETVA